MEDAKECREFELSFCQSQTHRVSNILRLVTKSSLFSIIPLWYSTTSMAPFTFAQIFESLKIGYALNSLRFEWKFVNLEYQTPINCKF